MLRILILIAVFSVSNLGHAKFEEPCESVLKVQNLVAGAQIFQHPVTGYFAKRMLARYTLMDPMVMTGAYLSIAQQAEHQVQTVEGRLSFQGQPMGHARCEVFTYVMLPDGSIFASKWNQNYFQRLHHSSLAKGEPVAAAGEMSVCAGTIRWINNRSGHYQPPVGLLAQFLHRLRSLGYSGEKPILFNSDGHELRRFPEMNERALRDLVRHNRRWTVRWAEFVRQ